MNNNGIRKILRLQQERPTVARSSIHGPQGFTMIELLVVVSIMVVVMAMALPNVFTTIRYRTLQNALSSSAGAIQSTRFQSIAKGVPYKLVFSSSARTFQVFACSNCANIDYDPTASYTFTALPAPLNNPIPFSTSNGATLAADQTLYFKPGGAVQWTLGTTDCSTSQSMTFSYRGVSKSLTVECYGNVTVPQ